VCTTDEGAEVRYKRIATSAAVVATTLAVGVLVFASGARATDLEIVQTFMTADNAYWAFSKSPTSTGVPLIDSKNNRTNAEMFGARVLSLRARLRTQAPTTARGKAVKQLGLQDLVYLISAGRDAAAIANSTIGYIYCTDFACQQATATATAQAAGKLRTDLTTFLALRNQVVRAMHVIGR
jgi:hypothetical protein